jgi:hypothetical protein
MPTSSNNQSLLLPISILVAGVLISGSVWFTRPSLRPTNQLRQQVAGERKAPEVQLQNRPVIMPTSSQPVLSNQGSVGSLTGKKFTWKEFEVTYPASLSLERTQTGWQLNGSTEQSHIGIYCPSTSLTQYAANLKVDQERTYTRNGRTRKAVLLSGPYKSPIDGSENPNELLIVIQGGLDGEGGKQEGCDISLATEASRSNRALYDTYEFAKELYQSIK